MNKFLCFIIGTALISVFAEEENSARCGSGKNEGVYRCVPFFNCDPETGLLIPTEEYNGAGVINMLLNNNCPGLLEVCCKVPPEVEVSANGEPNENPQPADSPAEVPQSDEEISSEELDDDFNSNEENTADELNRIHFQTDVQNEWPYPTEESVSDEPREASWQVEERNNFILLLFLESFGRLLEEILYPPVTTEKHVADVNELILQPLKEEAADLSEEGVASKLIEALRPVEEINNNLANETSPLVGEAEEALTSESDKISHTADEQNAEQI